MKFEIYSDGNYFKWRVTQVLSPSPGTGVGIVFVVCVSGRVFATRDNAQADYDAFVKWASQPPPASN
jgi:hypothetical protein